MPFKTLSPMSINDLNAYSLSTSTSYLTTMFNAVVKKCLFIFYKLKL